jgi:ribosomal protein S18 acetylase RimI-like enzyme
MTTIEHIRQIEEVSLTLWPALQTAFDDGWVLRFGEGFTRRSNSINAIYPSTFDPVEKIGRCAALYRARGLRPVFKLHQAVQPPDLDAILEAQGYAAEGYTGVQTLDLRGLQGAVSDQVQLSPHKSQGWVDACVAFNAFDPARGLTLSRILDNLVAAAAFATIEVEGQIAAVGLGLAAQGWLGLFDIATAPEQRNRGLGRAVVSSLLHWGRECGAQTAFLQVVPQNAPALQLYAGLGFREIYQYWYRAL